MENKQIHLRMKSKSPSGRQEIWEKIRENRECFTLRQIAFLIPDLSDTTLCTYVGGLTKLGFLEKQSEAFKETKFRLIKDVGAEAPQIAIDGEQACCTQMWIAMRRLGQFTLKDLQISASTEETPILQKTAKTYATFLSKAGYLKPQGKDRYAFIAAKYTGSKAPIIQSLKSVFDPNLRKIITD